MSPFRGPLVKAVLSCEVVIAFPTRDQAYGWYRSPEYQAILPLRTNNSVGGAAIVDGVPQNYRASSYLEKMAR